ncbi:probable DNA helicase MCM8 isoform X2 [Tanacetum coccineum]|uniref:Probable DNA helicase MCM8 isoform X2 n=1 Tax=Tanacetum coccineum TaxID=301880 RepID=A0ABQ5IL43_9ASTR
MSEHVIDLVEDILLRLDAEDLLRCKSVCKSWLWHIVGSSNGLVCVTPVEDQVLVTNPSTREVRKLPPAPRIPNFVMDRQYLCWGFGHDLSTDDYKVVMGTTLGKAGTLFRLFSLKSNTWKVIAQINYKLVVSSRFGFLYNGALHWFMKVCNTKKRVILSFDLSREEFKEIPKPDDSIYVCDFFNKLGILKGCLCIFRIRIPPHKRWVMRNNNDKEYWCLCDDDCEMDKFDITHTLNSTSYFPHNNWWLSDGGICLDSTRKYIGAPIFVKSLVSPHLNKKPRKKRHAKNTKRNLKAVSNYDVISRSFSFSLGILGRKRKTKNRNLKGKSKGKNQGLYYLYLEGISVKNSKSQSVSDTLQDTEPVAKATDLLDLYSFSQRDLEFVAKFSSEHGSDVFRQVLQSVCPSIYGHELVKAGITLELFGGVRKHSMDQNKVPVRGDIHVIIVGDPGLGKSQLLQAAASVSPRGAMVLADRGLCCIDESDKMSAEHQVAKAGLVASLSAQTTVLAAANPVGGHYNRAKTVNENLRINAPLLSRFDLVFILLDKPDELLDKRVSEHIMSLHASNGDTSQALKKLKESRSVSSVDLDGNSGSLVTRLRLDPRKDRDFAPLLGPLLRKYIASEVAKLNK